MNSITELLGKRILVRFRNTYKHLNTQEAIVMEISPSKRYIRLLLKDGSDIWVRYLKEVKILEVLNR